MNGHVGIWSNKQGFGQKKSVTAGAVALFLACGADGAHPEASGRLEKFRRRSRAGTLMHRRTGIYLAVSVMRRSSC